MPPDERLRVEEPLTDEQLPELLSLAVAAAQSASELILSGFRSPSLTAQKKADGSPVTYFDRAAEHAIRKFLADNQPRDWPVLGEELGEDPGRQSRATRYRWVVDPIDGTFSFSRGLPVFGTLLALEDVVARRALVGVIHLPAMDETYSACRGHGAWCAAERLQVAPARELGECLISAPAAHQFHLAGIAESHGRLRVQVPHLRCYADCWAHAMVARGHIDALGEFNLARWDIAASEVIIAEAGGSVLIREAHSVKGKYDIILGSPDAASAIAEILRVQWDLRASGSANTISTRRLRLPSLRIFTTRIAPISPMFLTWVPPQGCRSMPGIRSSLTRPAPRGGCTLMVFTRSGRASSSCR